MYINRIKDKQLSDYILNLIKSTEEDLVLIIFDDAKFKYLRNKKFLDLYYKSGTKMLIDQGNPTLSDCSGYEVLSHFLPNLSEDILNDLKNNYTCYVQISQLEMLEVMNSILEKAYLNNDECLNIYSSLYSGQELKNITIDRKRNGRRLNFEQGKTRVSLADCLIPINDVKKIPGKHAAIYDTFHTTLKSKRSGTIDDLMPTAVAFKKLQTQSERISKLVTSKFVERMC